MADSPLNAYVLALENAKTDNEKFAALLMVSKVTSHDNCEMSEKKLILEAIGPKFFSRLLKTKNVPEGCPASIYKTVAMSILSALCTEPDVACSPTLLDNITSFNGIILEDPSEGDGPERQLVDDTYECYCSLCQTDVGRDGLERARTVSSLCHAVTTEVYGHEKAQELLLYLLAVGGPGAWDGCGPALGQLLRHLAHQFMQDQTATKFKLCQTLIILLGSKPIMSQSEDTSWEGDVVTGLDSMLRSKLGSSHRELALRLAATLLDACGVECLLPPYLPDNKLFLLIIHLCCVEVRMVLEDPDISQASEKSQFLTVCYTQLEMIIGYMTQGGTPTLDQRQIVQLHAALVGAYSAVLHFLTRISQCPINQWNAVVLATVRVLAAWLAEETCALKEEVNEILPFILQISKMSLPPDDYVEPEKRSNGGEQVNTAGTVDSAEEQSCIREQDNNNVHPEPAHSRVGVADSSDGNVCDTEADITPVQAAMETISIQETDYNHSGADRCGQSVCDTVQMCDKDHNNSSEDSVQGSESAVCNEETRNLGTDEQARLQVNSEVVNNSTAIEGQSSGDLSTANKPSECTSHTGKPTTEDSDLSSQSNIDQERPRLSKLTEFMDTITGNSGGAAGSECTATEPLTESDLRDLHVRVDIVRFLLPGFCHLTAEDEPRAILVREGALSLLDLYMWRQWNSFSQNRQDRELQSGMVILCNIFLNLVIVEPRLVTEREEFSHVLLLVVKTVTQIEFDSAHLVLWSHMLTLGLMLMRALAPKTDEFLEKESISEFFQSVVRFVSGTYIADRGANGVTCLARAEDYTRVWDQMSQTWFLSMQALCACIPLYEVLPPIILKVGWIPSLLKTLLQVKGQGVEEETSCCFQLFLTTVANRNKAARTVVKEKSGVDVARMYKWKELSDALQR